MLAKIHGYVHLLLLEGPYAENVITAPSQGKQGITPCPLMFVGCSYNALTF